MKLHGFEEEIFFSTVRITVAGDKSPGASIGTGFLLLTPIDESNGKSITLLFSNRHVFCDPESNLQLQFHVANTDRTEPLLGQVLEVHQKDFSGVYLEHPDPSVDLACLNVSGITRIEPRPFFKTLVPEMIVDFESYRILPGTEVSFIGYPENIFDETHNLPLIRRGHIASIPGVDFNGQKQFVIDAQVWPGSSGSPVFVLGPERKYMLVGVVSATMVKNHKLEIMETALEAKLPQVLGLGIVVKSICVRELIEAARKKALEAQNISEQEPRK